MKKQKNYTHMYIQKSNSDPATNLCEDLHYKHHPLTTTHLKMKSIKVEAKKLPKRIDEIVSDAKETMADKFVSLKEAAKESLEDNDKKPKLRRETFENSSRMQQFKERPFLLVFIIIVQVSSSGTLSFPDHLSLRPSSSS